MQAAAPLSQTPAPQAQEIMLPAAITHAQAGQCLDAIAQALRDPSANPAAGVLLNAEKLREFDSSALAVMLECRRAALAQGRAFALRNLNRRLGELATAYGVAGLLEVGPPRAD